MDQVKLIPLYGREGDVRAYALVDEADAAWVGQWRWHLHEQGYAIRKRTVAEGRGDGKVFLHRELLGLPKTGDGREGDHVNRNRLDNRRSNLRVVTKAENMQNLSAQAGGASEHRGVFFDQRRGNWRARVRHGRRVYHLGMFPTEAAAAQAAISWRQQNMPLSDEDREAS